jgi:hypothetical protein
LTFRRRPHYRTCGAQLGRSSVTKKQRAVQLRDLVLMAIEAIGTGPNGDRSAIGERPNHLYISYRAIPYPRAHPTLSKNLPYDLDIWWNNKVLNIEWSDDGRIEVVSYEPGPWEGELERACQDTVRSRDAAVDAA